MRQHRMEQIESCEARLRELEDLKAGHEMALAEIEAEIEELEWEIEDHNEYLYEDGSEQDEWRADDDAQRAADMNATLRDIAGGF